MSKIELLVVAHQPELIAQVLGNLTSEPTTAGGESRFAIYHVTSLTEGLTAVAQHSFDAALIELNLPDAPELEGAHQFSQLAPRLPILTFGENHDPDLALQAVQAGAQDYLVAAELDEYWLAHTIRHAIDRHQTTESVRQYAQFQEALNAVTRLALQPLPLQEMLRQLANQTQALFNCDGCYITRWDESQQLTIPTAASDPLGDIYRLIKPEPGEETQTSRALELEQIVIAEDLLAGPDHAPKLAHTLPARALLTIPLIAGKRKLGAVLLAYNQPHQYTPTEKEQAEQLGRQLSLVIAQAQLLEEEQHQRRLADGLREGAAAITSTLDLDQVLEGILIHMAKVVSFDSACIFLRENGSLLAVAAHGLPYPDQVLGKRMFITEDDLHATIAKTQQPLLIEDVKQDERFRSWGGTSYVRGWIGLPLRGRGRIIGHVTLDHREPGAFTEQDAVIALAFADQAAIAIENARLFAAEQERNHELMILVNIANILRTSESRHDMLGIILGILLNLFSARGIILTVQDWETKEMVVTMAVGIWSEITEIRTQPDESISHTVMQTGELYLDNNAQGRLDPRLASLDLEQRVKAVVCIPLTSVQIGLGAIWIGREQPFIEKDLNLLVTIGDMVANALHRDLLHERAEEQVIARTAELAAANERLRDLDRLKSKFVTDISHELRTPVTNLNLYLHLLEKGKSDKAEQYMTVLKGQVARLGQMVEDILSLTRLDIDRTNVILKPLDLNRLLQVVASTVRPRLETTNLVLNLDLPANALMIYGDQNQLQQLFHHLLTNAINYTPSGQIEIGARPSSDGEMAVEAWVADSGIGIRTEDLPHIFERFYRGKLAGQSNIPGTGLGLSLVQEIITIHHGRIAVSQNDLGGTTFTILFPGLPAR